MPHALIPTQESHPRPTKAGDLAARVAALADDLAAYNPGHGDYQTAAVFVRALLDEETAK